MSSADQATDLFRLRLHANVSFDVCCNIPALTNGIITQLQTQGFNFDDRAPIKVILDVPQGYAFRALEKMNRQPEEKESLRLVVVTFNSCPEYLEDLWDLQPTILLANPSYDYDLPLAIASAGAGLQYRTTNKVETHLSPRERQVLHYLARNWSYKEIAIHLNLQEKTIRNSSSLLYKKLGTTDRGDTILYYWGCQWNTDRQFWSSCTV